MIIPSETLYTYLSRVSHGIFFEIADIGTEHSKVDLVAKLPTEIIKYIYHRSSTFLSMKSVPINDSISNTSRASFVSISTPHFHIKKYEKINLVGTTS